MVQRDKTCQLLWDCLYLIDVLVTKNGGLGRYLDTWEIFTSLGTQHSEVLILEVFVFMLQGVMTEGLSRAFEGL
ncbi:UNVERIFIED_CONTAM: hypothetical protein Sradi_5734300 [Sesamum radiatum]|uniref:Uncharacterized protein n=1 Tax=Sesamum radiatum TaxID=300843 RepID=A0AAW2L270_SESRA